MKLTPIHPTRLAVIAILAFTSGRLQAASAAPTLEGSLQTDTAPSWTLHTAYSHSFLNKGNGDWSKEVIDVYHFLPNQKLLLGLGVDFEQRSSNRDDIVYGVNAAWYAAEKLEMHAAIELVEDADFLPSESYLIGVKHRYDQRIEAHFELEHLEFSDPVAGWDDGITQIKPGITWWFDDHNRMTLQYTHGWVHGDEDYDYYSAKFHFGDLIRDGTLSVGFAYGTDPDFSFGTGATTLSDAYLVSVFYTEPITKDLTIYGGVEYVYRMRSDTDGELYQMWTPTIGLSWKF